MNRLSATPGGWRWEDRGKRGWWRVHDRLAIEDGPHAGRPLRRLLRPDPWGKTWRGRVYFGTLDTRRWLAAAWRDLARAVDRWIEPGR